MWNPFASAASKRPADVALHAAIARNDAQGVADALDSDAEVLARNKYGYSALEMARLLGRDALLAQLGYVNNRRIQLQAQEETFPQKRSISQFEAITGVRYFSHLRFDSYSVFKKAYRQCSWLQRYTAWGKELRWLGKWHADDRDEGHLADVSVRWIDQAIGYGLFAERKLEPLTYLGQYTGTVRQWSMRKRNHNAYCFHYPTSLWRLRIFMIDALDGGNEMRFVNHADAPNAEPAIQLDRGLLHVFFRTTKEIGYGEQICIDYGKDYWHRRLKIPDAQLAPR